ncbi:extracellular solute-binding protein [Cohnella sp. CFH 77786]|nr:extracellular solute-binding protein [Cohnella sp. CFH 77786]
MSKKWVVLLVGLMLIFSLAACGSGSNSAGSTNTPSQAASSDPAATNASEETNVAEEDAVDSNGTPEMDFDMGGKTIKVVAWYDKSIKEDNPDNIQRKKNLEALEKKHNFKMEYVSVDWGEYQSKVTASLLSGEPIGDIVALGISYTIPTLTKQGLLWPVDEYTTNGKVFNQKIRNEMSQYNGKSYGFQADLSNPWGGIYYNRTLMDKLGMKPLQEYVDNDQWNWDTFMQVAKEATRDTNNDGKLDTWGLTNFNFFTEALISNEADLVNGDKQSLDDPKTVEALNLVSRILTEKVARPQETGAWDEPGRFFRQGNVLLYPGPNWDIGNIKKDMENSDIGFLPYPKGPSASEYHYGTTEYEMLTIPKAVEHPERLIYIWEKIHDIDSVYDYPEQAGLEQNFTNEADINNALLTSKGYVLLKYGTFPKNPYFQILGDILNGESVSTVVEKYKAVTQSAIDEVYKK